MKTRSHLINIVAVALSLGAAGIVVACSEKGPAEKAGEQLDSAIERQDNGVVTPTDGPMENAGEAMDKAADNAAKAAKQVGEDAQDAAKTAQDKIDDATH